MSNKKFTPVEKLEISLLGLISFDSEELRLKYKEKINKTKQLEKQHSDNYAIEFAEWCIDEENNLSYYKRLGKSKELLEIFKKEKGL
jgi:hypothetical protein